LEAPQNGFSPPIRIVATRRRRRTVSAKLTAGVLELQVPDWMSQAERDRWAENMRLRMERKLLRRAPTDERLSMRASMLNDRLFNGRLRWNSISWCDMAGRWGDCAVATGEIRIARRAIGLPEWVIDYLLVHEMSHLEHGDHGPAFKQMVSGYTLTERAKGYLMAIDHGVATIDEERPVA